MRNLGLILLLLIIPVIAFAQVVLPETVEAQIEWAKLIEQLIANPKAFTAAVIGALIILLVVQALKSQYLKKFFKNVPGPVQFAIITILGQAYSILLHVTILKDQQISVALVGVFSSGGAAAMFNAMKLVFEKPKALL